MVFTYTLADGRNGIASALRVPEPSTLAAARNSSSPNGKKAKKRKPSP
jgi:hypothetical protein